MLVVISDLHLTDGTAGEHNLPHEAFSDVFLSDIASFAKRKGAKEVTVLLLGDIFDLIRSEQWLNQSEADRPWGATGIADLEKANPVSAVEQTCLRILGQMPTNRKKPSPENTILYKNWETLQFFRDLEKTFKSKLGIDLPVTIIYILGNHDRLCNVYPSVRDRIKDFLGLSDHSFTKDHNGVPWFTYEFLDRHYGVYARHGHHSDIYNFAGGVNCYDKSGFIRAPIGDVITTEFAVKIPWQMNELRLGKYASQIDPSVVESLKDIDNVRPLGGILEWIYYRIKEKDKGPVRDALNQTLSTIVEDILKIELVQKWRSPGTHWDEVLRTVSYPWLNWLPKLVLDSLQAEDLLPLFLGFTEGPPDPAQEPTCRSAYNDSIWRKDKDIRFIVNGHTHTPAQIPLDCEGEREIFYINTGTWRNRIYRTVGLDTISDFVELKQMSYAVFYGPDEDRAGKKSGTPSFEVWTGTKKKHYA